MVSSLDSDSPMLSYVGVFLSKSHSVAWIQTAHQACRAVSQDLTTLSTDSSSYHKHLAFLFLPLIIFTSSSTWRLIHAPAALALASPRT
jgi:hypothetical protein